MTRRALPIALLAYAALAGCTSRGAPDTLANDSRRQAEQLENQARTLRDQAENNVGSIERAMENESRALFENRERMLNGALDAADAIETAPDAGGPAPEAPRRR